MFNLLFFFRGHSPDWYKKVYGHICANFMDRIRSSFHCNTEGPETKVWTIQLSWQLQGVVTVMKLSGLSENKVCPLTVLSATERDWTWKGPVSICRVLLRNNGTFCCHSVVMVTECVYTETWKSGTRARKREGVYTITIGWLPCCYISCIELCYQ